MDPANCYVARDDVCTVFVGNNYTAPHNLKKKPTTTRKTIKKKKGKKPKYIIYTYIYITNEWYEKNHVGEVIRTERIYIIIYINVWTVYLYNIILCTK